MQREFHTPRPEEGRGAFNRSVEDVRDDKRSEHGSANRAGDPVRGLRDQLAHLLFLSRNSANLEKEILIARGKEYALRAALPLLTAAIAISALGAATFLIVTGAASALAQALAIPEWGGRLIVGGLLVFAMLCAVRIAIARVRARWLAATVHRHQRQRTEER